MTNIHEGIQLQAGQFIEGVRVLVEQAVMEALSNSVCPTKTTDTRNGEKEKKQRRERPRNQSRRSSKRTRRRSSEVEAMTEQFYNIIELHPGQTMAVLATFMEREPKDLQVSMRKLLREGRVRKAGERMHTKYFPMGMGSEEA